MSHEKETIQELVPEIKKAGFRVFLAESGRYGFYTDKEGSRLVSFQVDYLSPSYGGKYKTDQPAKTGTGWRIAEGYDKDFKEMFNECAPHWAVGDANWKYTTLEQHLDFYQKSSKYKEV